MDRNRPAIHRHRDPRTRIAFLGTLGGPDDDGALRDVDRLRDLVQALEPDLLGIEAEPAVWESGDSGALPIEIRDGLVRGTQLGDRVVIPLGGPSSEELAAPLDGNLVELRAGLIRTADRLLVAVGRGIDDPRLTSRGPYLHLCAAICHVEAAAASELGARARVRTNERILERLVDALRRDPGNRFLVAVRCQRIHYLRTRLQAISSEVELVPFEAFAVEHRRPEPRS
jgi:hypothetical protein